MRFSESLLSESVGVLVLATVLSVGCQSAMEESNQTTTATQPITPSECEPSEPYNECYEVDLDNAATWQSMVEAGEAEAWRTVQESEIEAVDYEVTIDTYYLNGGVIPTAEQQGHYESEDHFYHVVKSELLGVPEEARVLLTTHGPPTVKLVDDRSAFSEASTGKFVYDAMTTAEGELYINGENRDDLLYRVGSRGYVIENNDSSSSTTTKSFAAKQRLKAKKYSAKQRAIAFNYTLVSEFAGVIKNIEKNGKHCRWVWKVWKGFRECYGAEFIQVTNTYKDANSNKLFTVGPKNKSDTDKLRLDYLDWHLGPKGWGYVREVCTKGEVHFPSGRKRRGHLCERSNLAD